MPGLTGGQAAVIIPVYRNELSHYETVALRQCISTLSAHPLVVVKPQNMVLTGELAAVSWTEVVEFDPGFFSGIEGYNRLMLSAAFYTRLSHYEFILIHQLDCLVFKDELKFWCEQDWDYIGAPWIQKTYHKTWPELLWRKLKRSSESLFRLDQTKRQRMLENRVGNGGFSLRRTAKFRDIAATLSVQSEMYLSRTCNLYNEDVFWSIEVNKTEEVLRIPDWETALKFAFEVPPGKLSIPEKLPFGCHDWDHYLDYWQPVFSKLGISV
ncbi:hypothetical protein C7T94_01755 [Pedobacter yulinensis]|uniref:DUF5672 domain-containing protein n=1 Tax=Pedobacter yulinensis TaxID=2126353 RepID=A0A2T3HQY8_9SPHI|nr:DUF5672 family protein [Pedobacter yulinensis]PST84874.1 hypothetical protein C7T94_01755 [Pedobacter yulinensis]